ncbi:hypothetical protein E2C01_082427 [Portunus trituberculatus]|uniref:Uncharacterized protein n=1 Tax=Portunus trituberculatus TaxID=210409 RepID=A0A5B7IPX0_PORTR|nr:hypothetical protein [Portunus trituberculatus]
MSEGGREGGKKGGRESGKQGGREAGRVETAVLGQSDSSRGSEKVVVPRPCCSFSIPPFPPSMLPLPRPLPVTPPYPPLAPTCTATWRARTGCHAPL